MHESISASYTPGFTRNHLFFFVFFIGVLSTCSNTDYFTA